MENSSEERAELTTTFEVAGLSTMTTVHHYQVPATVVREFQTSHRIGYGRCPQYVLRFD